MTAGGRPSNGMLPSDFFRRNVVLNFQEDVIGIRLRDVIGVDVSPVPKHEYGTGRARPCV
jgi:hypothetical protein